MLFRSYKAVVRLYVTVPFRISLVIQNYGIMTPGLVRPAIFLLFIIDYSISTRFVPGRHTRVVNPLAREDRLH